MPYVGLFDTYLARPACVAVSDVYGHASYYPSLRLSLVSPA